jgi:hypothetical protein
VVVSCLEDEQELSSGLEAEHNVIEEWIHLRTSMHSKLQIPSIYRRAKEVNEEKAEQLAGRGSQKQRKLRSDPQMKVATGKV